MTRSSHVALLPPASLRSLAPLLALGGLLAIGCDRAGSPAMSNAPHVSELGCELVVGREGDRLTLAFALANRSPQPRTIRYHRPFMLFDLRAVANGQELPIVRADFDAPVQPAELQLPGSGRGTLDTPVRLRFSPAREMVDDSFVWTIVGEPATVELHATLNIEGISLPACITRVDRA